MEEKHDIDKADDILLPGFRFHPTDEELVGFYLKRKIQQKPLHIELIKQVDIYKYDPWDLPKLATTGEKEWYFYCQRDRKYRNSSRPNRVTRGGFWKATGTDRPIYSSNATNCIGLKKSLVFYKGRAAKGMKTDWMMHEFRLPSSSESHPQKKLHDKNLSAHDTWAICRIFKKTNPMAQRPFASLQNVSTTTEIGSTIHLCCNDIQTPLEIPNFSYKVIPVNNNPTIYKHQIFTSSFPNNLVFSPMEMPQLNCDAPSISMLLNDNNNNNKSAAVVDDFKDSSQQVGNNFLMGLDQEMAINDNEVLLKKNSTSSNDWGSSITSVGFPYNLPSDLSWESPSCLGEMSTSYSTQKIYYLEKN